MQRDHRPRGQSPAHQPARKLAALAALGALGTALFVACAGVDTPPVDDDLRQDLATGYTGPAAGAGGTASGNAGRGGSANTAGRGGGSAAGAGGAPDDEPSASAGSAGAAGSGMASGGAAGSGTASGGAAGAGSPSPATCNGFAVLEANCSTTNCHGAGSNLGNFAESEEIARTFVGRTGGVCAGEGVLIDPENPADSVLILKLRDEASCGQPMPLGAFPMPDTDIDCIEDWIGGLAN